MTKQDFQKELKEKVKEGIKPSHLKKLKRSKSEGDIPSSPTSPTLKIKQLEDKISVLELTIETKDRELESNLLAFFEKDREITEKAGTITVYSEQLTTKQKEIETLRSKLEESNTELKSLKENHSSLLDQNLTLKHQNLKDWWKQYEKTQELETELKENVEYASNELLEQDKVIEKLRGETARLKQTNQSLQKDLNLATKLAELRKKPLPTPENTFWPTFFYGLALVLFINLLNSSWKKYHFKDH